MNYQELSKIVKNRINIPQKSMPIDCFAIAVSLGLRLKNSIETRHDYINGDNPLEWCDGCLALNKGEYTIYYNEKSPYSNFTVAHEVAHYLLHHHSDGMQQHHDANILAAMLVAPEDLILSGNIKSAAELSTVCNIPAEVANTYWAELKSNDIANESSSKKIEKMASEDGNALKDYFSTVFYEMLTDLGNIQSKFETERKIANLIKGHYFFEINLDLYNSSNKSPFEHCYEDVRELLNVIIEYNSQLHHDMKELFNTITDIWRALINYGGEH